MFSQYWLRNSTTQKEEGFRGRKKVEGEMKKPFDWCGKKSVLSMGIKGWVEEDDGPAHVEGLSIGLQTRSHHWRNSIRRMERGSNPSARC